VFDAPEYPEQLEFDLNPQEFAAHAAAYGEPTGELTQETGWITWDEIGRQFGLTKEDFNQDEETMSKAADE
jgi:hypothetical protein